MHNVPKAGPSSSRVRSGGDRDARRRAPAPVRPRLALAAGARFAASAALAASLGQAGCFDWDAFDPRLTGGAAGTAAPGGGGAGATGTATTMGGTGGTGAVTTTAMGGTGGGGAGGTGGGGTGGGGMPLDPCGKTDLLQDDFEDGATGAAWAWVPDPTATVTETGGEAVVTLPAGSGSVVYGAFQTLRYYDLRDSSVSVKVSAPSISQNASAFLVARYDQSNYAELSLTSGKLSAVRVVNGLVSTILQKTYDPVTHAFWRLRHSGMQLFWETSPDGVNFSNLASASNGSLFDLSSVRIDMGGRTPAGEASPTELRFDDMNGDVLIPGKWCPASALKDDFADPAPGRAWLRSYDGAMGNCTLVEEGGSLALKMPAGQTSYCAHVSSSSYDLTGSEVIVEVPSITEPATNAEIFLRLELDSENNVEITQTAANVIFRQKKDGVPSGIGATSYSSDVRWWRIAQRGTDTHFDYSKDGLDWIPGASGQIPLDLTAVDVVIGGGTYVSSGSAVEATFDNVNVPP